MYFISVASSRSDTTLVMRQSDGGEKDDDV